MLSKETKELIEMTEGKIILSEGNIEKSYIIMKLKDYLKEKRDKLGIIKQAHQQKITKKQVKSDEWLTDENNLDKMEAEMEEFLRREKERELEELFKAEKEEYQYERF